MGILREFRVCKQSSISRIASVCVGVLMDEEVVGGIGMAEFPGFSDCCELQKLYLSDSVKGRGLGYEMIQFIEEKAREAGYKQMYLETHDIQDSHL